MSADMSAITGRVLEAQQRAEDRLRRQRDLLRPLGWAVVGVVLAGVVTQRSGPAVTGSGLAVAMAAAVFAASTLAAIGNRFLDRSPRIQAEVMTAMGGAGVALSWLQPRGSAGLAGGAAAWMAITRLALPVAVPLAAAIAVGTAAAAARSGSLSTVLAVLLLTALLSLIAFLMRQGREGQARTEVLLAELADARDAQAEAAVLAERGRIAAELHDVLAHTLSGAALQLQGARMLAERDSAGETLTAAIERAAQLVGDGLVNARHAVQALRGADLPSLAQLEGLVESFRRDMSLDVTLRIEGTAHALPPELGLALYRGVEEALTNVARHSAGAPARVVLAYRPDRTTLEVANAEPPAGRTASPVADVGGGNGLAGLRERIEHAGGRMEAGPTSEGWRVSLAVPA